MNDYDNYLQSFDPAGSSVEDDFRPYGLVTIVQNSMGHLEMWQGKQTAFPADVYIQVDTDVDAITDYLSDSEREKLDRYGEVETYFVPEDYFPEKGSIEKIVFMGDSRPIAIGVNGQETPIYYPLSSKHSVMSNSVTALNGGMILPKADDYLFCGVTLFRGYVAGILVRNETVYLVEMKEVNSANEN